jgi:hypothetical protein
MRQPLTALLSLAVCTACTEDPPPNGPFIESHVDYWDIPSGLPGELDLLIVVDNTAGMASHRQQLLDLASSFDTILFGENGPFFDTRIAVTTTATSGAFRQPAGAPQPFLESALDAHYDLTNKFAGSLTDALAPLLDVGSTGTEAIAPLASAKAALDSHPGFVREYAMLGIVTIASGDDASSGEPPAYAASLKNRKYDPAMVAVTAAYPMPSPRLGAFHDGFPNRSSVVDIDMPDWIGVAAIFPQLRRTTLGAACVRMPADVAPEIEGLQADCVVEAVYRDDTTELLPACTEGGTERCFEIVPDPTLCSFTEEGYGRLYIRGYPGGYTPSVRGQCVVF